MAVKQITAIKKPRRRFWDWYYQPPPYGERSRILFRVVDVGTPEEPDWEVEALDWDGGSAFWINESIGFDWWLKQCDLKAGVWVIENLTSHSYQDYWGEWDEDYNHDPMRPATPREIRRERLARSFAQHVHGIKDRFLDWLHNLLHKESWQP
ncbi:MAG TPA: hypothetical protein VJM79_01230 [Rhizorhapis sp.]|nr:hypothetical protein [Rhizorhapis sp.]